MTIPWDAVRHCWEEIATPAMRAMSAGYARDLGACTRPAVLAIDLYAQAFAGDTAVDPALLQATFPGSCGRFAHEALPAVTSVLATARRLRLPVFHSTLDRSALSAAPATRRRDTAAVSPALWAFQPECAPEPGEAIVPKRRASAFFGSGLGDEMRQRGVETVIVVGETTSGCVRASVVDAYSHGFAVVVVEDAVFDRSWLNHCVNLFDMHHKYADVLPSSAVIQMLRDAL